MNTDKAPSAPPVPLKISCPSCLSMFVLPLGAFKLAFYIELEDFIGVGQGVDQSP